MLKIVAILLVNPQGEVLLLHRDNDPAIYAPGKWNLVGGHVEPGETLDQAIRRETEEEIGYQLREFRVFDEQHAPGLHVSVFAGSIDRGLHQLVLGEGQGLGFFCPTEALTKLDLTESARAVLTTYVEAKRGADKPAPLLRRLPQPVHRGRRRV